MTEPKFTKGPWEVRRSAERHDGEYDFAISAPGALVLAESFGRDAVGRRPPAEANARLIAAAPQMYEALKALFESYKELADSGDAGFWSLEDTLEGKQALAALSAATGGSDAGA